MIDCLLGVTGTPTGLSGCAMSTDAGRMCGRIGADSAGLRAIYDGKHPLDDIQCTRYVNPCAFCSVML